MILILSSVKDIDEMRAGVGEADRIMLGNIGVDIIEKQLEALLKLDIWKRS